MLVQPNLFHLYKMSYHYVFLIVVLRDIAAYTNVIIFLYFRRFWCLNKSGDFLPEFHIKI